jgi:WD40 repeat protein
MLISGGGNKDKMIQLWNVLIAKNIDSLQTTSQICALEFSKNTNEFVSAHGFSDNSIMIWNFP